MLPPDFTLLHAYEQFWIAVENDNRSSLTRTGQVYGYLVHIWNTCGRLASFRRQNNLICAELCISKPTLDRNRQILKNCGLIDFFSKGKGDSNISYEILDYRSSKKNLLPKAEKVKIFTTCVTSHVTSPDVYNIKEELKEKELVVEVSGVVKNFYYLKNLFEDDVGLKMKWAQNGFSAEKFSDGIQDWLINNHRAKYPNEQELRKHFLYWIPNYGSKQNLKNGSKTINRSDAKPGTSAARIAALKNF